jgi:hypothetical protein
VVAVPSAIPHLRAPADRSTVRHDKCYARVLDGCSSKISGEHPQSDGVLREVESAEGGVYVSGHKWLKGEKRRIGINSLVGKVLCTNHNSLLSPLDEEAKRFVRLSEPFFGVAEINETINGTLLERYLLKVLTGSLLSASWDTTFQPPEWWLHVIFGHRKLMHPLGLYMNLRKGDRVGDIGQITHVPLFASHDRRVVGIQASLRAFKLRLIADLPIEPGFWAESEGDVWRSGGFNKGKGTSALHFRYDWEPQFSHLWWPRDSPRRSGSRKGVGGDIEGPEFMPRLPTRP